MILLSIFIKIDYFIMWTVVRYTIMIAWFFQNSKDNLVSETTMYVPENCGFCHYRQNVQFEKWIFVQKDTAEIFCGVRWGFDISLPIQRVKEDQHFFISRM